MVTNLNKGFEWSEEHGAMLLSYQKKTNEISEMASWVANRFISQELIDESGLDPTNEEEASEFFLRVIATVAHELGLDVKELDKVAEEMLDNIRVISDPEDNPFIKNIKIQDIQEGNYELSTDHHSLEGHAAEFSAGFLETPHSSLYGVYIPCYEYLTKEYAYPYMIDIVEEVVIDDLSPQSMRSMEPSIQEAKGDTLVLGLGLGYWPYMASLKDEVTSITIVEEKAATIEVFKKHILSQFENKDKVTLIHANPLEYLESLADGTYDYCFQNNCYSLSEFDLYLSYKKAASKFSIMNIAHCYEDMYIRAAHTTVTALAAIALIEDFEENLDEIINPNLAGLETLEELYSNFNIEEIGDAFWISSPIQVLKVLTAWECPDRIEQEGVE